MPRSCLFRSFGSRTLRAPGFGPRGWSLFLDGPQDTLETRDMAGVVPLLDWAEARSMAGRWVALLLAYEAAPAFDDALSAAAPDPALPLAWAASFAVPSTPLPPPSPDAAGAWSLSPWRPLVDRQAFDVRVDRIKELIRRGETYQVNYTIPLEARCTGDHVAMFHDLGARQGAGFCACLDLGERVVLSFSPELFVLRRGGRALARPMKGTARRGRHQAEDRALARALAASSKDRAENVMITDLLRNDLGKLAVPGTVSVRRPFDVERYPTVHQMTSTVSARLRSGTTLVDMMKALFPCGSVTGAPKARAMQAINEAEAGARGAYCGAVGFLEPGGDFVLNVPIRTMVLDPATGRTRLQAGGGIVHDSTPGGEYAELLAKTAFAERPAPAFRLLESLLLYHGRFWLLERHLARLAFSAGRLGFAWDERAGRKALAALALEHDHAHDREHGGGRFKVRLLLDRQGGMELEALALEPGPAPAPRLAVAHEPGLRVDPGDLMFFHKTDRREVYERALAAHPDSDDVVLVNTRGEVTESSRANLVVRLDGRWLTPALDCGLLPGSFRERLVERGRLREAVIFPEDLARAEAVGLVNSVRGWMRAEVA